MSTSLAEQLKRLQTPQTAQLIDTKRRDSILFTPKEAATKSRETIFEIGISGFNSLAEINPVFLEFESTLFNPSSVEVQRAVESKEVNEKLNVHIRRFMYHLSPYFLMSESHKCLEWLIRRFNINQYNRDEFIMLILPYHQTNIFVRCIQTMKFVDETDKWYFLGEVKKSSAPLSKYALFNHGASQPKFLENIGKFTYDALKELDSKAGSLQTMLAFYCTTIIGSLEHTTKINENHILHISKFLIKTYKSKVLDFVAAGYMITAQLLVKSKLSVKLLEQLMDKITSSVLPSLNQNVILLLSLMFQTQIDTMKITDVTLENLINFKWLPAALDDMKKDGKQFTSFFRALICKLLEKIANVDGNFEKYKAFCEKLLKEIHLDDDEAEVMIKAILDSYIAVPTRENGNGAQKMEVDINVIELSSDEEDENIPLKPQDVTAWYSQFLKSLERQYPNAFDNVVKEVMSSMPGGKRNGLKNVLGFLLKMSCANNEMNVFENLYHHNAEQRQAAVEFLVDNFEKLMVKSDESSDILKLTVLERLSDDNADVVMKVLEISQANLLKLIGPDDLIAKLTKVLRKFWKNQQRWTKACNLAMRMLTSEEICKVADHILIFLAILPFLFPQCDATKNLYKIIVKESKFAKQSKLISALPKVFTNATSVLKTMESSKQNLKAEAILKIIEDNIVSETRTATLSTQFSLMALTQSIKETQLRPEFSLKIVQVMKQVIAKNRLTIVDGEIYNTSYLSSLEIPVQSISELMVKLIESTEFSTFIINFAEPSTEDQLKLEIFDFLVEKFFTCEPASSLRKSFNEILKIFLNKICSSKHELKVTFFSQFCTSHNVYREDLGESLELQVRSMRLLSHILSTNKDGSFPDEFYYHILIAMSSQNELVRQIAVEILDHLQSHDAAAKHWKFFLEKLQERKNEILMDSEQMSLVIFLLASKKSSAQIKHVIETICNAIEDAQTFDYIRSGLLDIIKHLTDKKVLDVMSTVAMDIMKAEKSELERFSDSESAILRMILMKINDLTIASLMSLAKLSLECHRLMYNEEAKFMTPSVLTLKSIDSNLYSKLHVESRAEFFEKIVKCSMSDQSKIVLAAQKCFHNLPIECSTIKHFLLKMPRLDASTERRKDKSQFKQSPLSRDEWKFGVSLLELLQSKTDKLKSQHELVPILFDILEDVLRASDELNVEYVVQVILSLLLDICQQITQQGKALKTFGLQETSIKPELVVKCIKESENPQTHHHALLLLAQLALLTPDQVLADMMTIFTFVGTTLARHEDSYSFQIIAKIIENIIPTITKSKQREDEVMPILKIFASIVLSVPDHRRLMIFGKLLRTLDESKFLWIFVGLVIQQQVVNHQKGNRSDKLPDRIEFALALTKEFDAKAVLEVAASLIVYLKKLPMFIDHKNEPVRIIAAEEQMAIFSVKTHTDFNLRHFKYLVLQYLKNLLSSPEVHSKIRRLSAEEKLELKGQFQDIILNVLTLIPEISKALDHQKMKPFEKSWHVILQNSFDILEASIDILEADMLLVVVENLILHDFLLVRKKVIELLNRKLEENFFDEVDDRKLLKLLSPLREIYETIGDDSNAAADVVQQVALLSIKLLARRLCNDNPDEFVAILGDLTNTLEIDNIKLAVKVNLIVCIAELTADLRVQAIGQLGNFMPKILELLKLQDDPTSFLLLYSVVTAILRIIETVAVFLSTYLVEIISHLCRLMPTLKLIEDSKITSTLTKISKIWSTMADLVPKRVLIPAIDEVYEEIVNKSKFDSVEPLMELLHEIVKQTEMKDLREHMSDLTDFFLKSLKIRSEVDDENVNEIEASVMQSFVALTLKLSEGSFRPLFDELHSWALREDPTKFDRAITFFRLTAEISSSLKSLFLLFASDVVDSAGPLLDKCNHVKSDNRCFDDEEKNLYLATFILKTLYNIFLHDHQNFINGQRFEVVMQPTVDMIENEKILSDENRKELLMRTIAQLPCSASDDILWKQLNYQVLMKTRSDSPEQRIFGLKICVEIAKKLGQSFESLMPETIPFLSELLEDEDYKVVEATQHGVRELEETVGESLQKYL